MQKRIHAMAPGMHTAAIVLAAAIAVTGPLAMTALAATSTIYATGVSGPAGQVWLPATTGPGHLWVSDHVQGFCRIEPVPGSTTLGINPSTCNTTALSPGQPAFDPASNFLYVPDGSSKSAGVVRLTYDPAVEAFRAATVLAPSAGLGGNRPDAVALGPDRNLYVSFLKNGSIVRITNPAGGVQSVQTIGQSSDGRRVLSLAFVGSDLFLAEGAQVSEIFNAPGCVSGCFASPAGAGFIAPLSLSASGGWLYIGDVSVVSRFNPATFALEQYSNLGSQNGGSVPYSNISALGFDAAGNIFVGDDPTAGAGTFQGRIWTIGGTAPPPGPPPPPPPPPTAKTTAALWANNVSGPSGLVLLGSHFWVSDHLQGFCRLDLSGTLYAVNPATCLALGGGAPGQPAFDRSTNFVYIPDGSSKSPGVWRARYDAATDRVVAPTVIAGAFGLGGDRPTSVALGSDGKLYVSFLKNGNIKRITTPAGTSQTVESVGGSSDGRRVTSIAFMGSDLYLAEGQSVTVIPAATSTACTGGCKAFVSQITTQTPAALVYDGAGLMYIGTLSTVARYSTATGVTELYTEIGILPGGGSTTFQNIAALGLDATGNIYLADDPSAGAGTFQGRIWRAPKVP